LTRIDLSYYSKRPAYENRIEAVDVSRQRAYLRIMNDAREKLISRWYYISVFQGRGFLEGSHLSCI
jgi:hypothetical protein